LGHIDRIEALARDLEKPAERGADGTHWLAAERTVVQLRLAGRTESGARLGASIEPLEPDLERDVFLRPRLLHARANRARIAGDLASYIELLERAVVAYDEAGHERNGSSARMSVGYGHVEIGSYADAEKYLRESLRTADRMNLSQIRAEALHN